MTFDLGRAGDPYALFAGLRAQGSVVPIGPDLWCVTRYRAADALLRDRRATSGPIARRYREALPPGAARDEMSHRINFMDPPDHVRVRRLALTAFTHRRIAELRPRVETFAADLLDGIGPADEVELLEAFAHPLPSRVISELLGVPVADRDQLSRWTEEVTPLLGVEVEAEEMRRALAASQAFATYVERLLEERRRRPESDLLSARVAAHDGEQRLSRPEILSLVVTLYSAGHRTTRDLFANGLSVLLRHRDQWERVRRDPAKVPRAVEEFLRFETPTLYVGRVPCEPIDLDGHSLPAGQAVIVLVGSANRDPDRFEDPDRFDVDRDQGEALSFAAGPHYCLGAALARMEVEVMLGAVARRWPDLELADDPLEWRCRGPFRGLAALRVRPGG